MVIKIDTDKKEITVEQPSTVGEVVDYLQKTHPNNWKDFKIVQEQTILPIYPYIPHVHPLPLPNQPYYYEYPITMNSFDSVDPNDQN